MIRLLLVLRMILEGLLGFSILLLLPFTAIQIVHGGGSTTHLLLAFLVMTIVFILGIVLFRDAVILRMRMKNPE